MRLFSTAAVGALLALTLVAPTAAFPVDHPDPDLAPAAQTETVTVACRPEDGCHVAAVRRLVVGAVARPAVQRPSTSRAQRTVVRPGALVPGKLRSPVRR